MANKESWLKNNIFSLISVGIMLIGFISAGAVMRFQFNEALKDIEEMKKDIKEFQAFGDVQNMRRLIDDKVFIMKTGLYKDIEKIEVLFNEKFINSQQREKELKEDLKELRKAIYSLKRNAR